MGHGMETKFGTICQVFMSALSTNSSTIVVLVPFHKANRVSIVRESKSWAQNLLSIFQKLKDLWIRRRRRRSIFLLPGARPGVLCNVKTFASIACTSIVVLCTFSFFVVKKRRSSWLNAENKFIYKLQLFFFRIISTSLIALKQIQIWDGVENQSKFSAVIDRETRFINFLDTVSVCVFCRQWRSRRWSWRWWCTAKAVQAQWKEQLLEFRVPFST